VAVNEVAQEYGQAYAAGLEEAGSRSSAPEEASSELGVQEVLYELMGERDKLVELAKLVGKLRFAVEGADGRLAAETEREFQALAHHLPQRYQLDRLLEVARGSSQEAAELARLYVERCYRLLDQDQAGLEAVEGRIQALEATRGSH
jgi:hypothetical protein